MERKTEKMRAYRIFSFKKPKEITVELWVYKPSKHFALGIYFHSIPNTLTMISFLCFEIDIWIMREVEE